MSPKILYDKLNQGINQYGFFYFISLSIQEKFYKYKFKKLGINYKQSYTSKEDLNKVSDNKDSKINQASAFLDIKKAFSFTGLCYTDINLLDIGCGNGKVLNLGMMLHFKKVTGIDLDETAIENATANCLQMHKKGYSTNYNISKKDASKYCIPEGVNVIYLFNPFGSSTMLFVVKNILAYFEKLGAGDLFVIYCIPVHQDLFLSNTQFTKIFERFTPDKTKSEMAIFKMSK